MCAMQCFAVNIFWFVFFFPSSTAVLVIARVKCFAMCLFVRAYKWFQVLFMVNRRFTWMRRYFPHKHFPALIRVCIHRMQCFVFSLKKMRIQPKLLTTCLRSTKTTKSQINRCKKIYKLWWLRFKVATFRIKNLLNWNYVWAQRESELCPYLICCIDTPVTLMKLKQKSADHFF